MTVFYTSVSLWRRDYDGDGLERTLRSCVFSATLTDCIGTLVVSSPITHNKIDSLGHNGNIVHIKCPGNVIQSATNQ